MQQFLVLIFKTFNGDIDNWTTRIGVFGRSFHDSALAIQNWRKELEAPIKGGVLTTSPNPNLLQRLFPTKKSIQSQLIDVDSAVAQIPKSQLSSTLNELSEIEKQVKANKITWTEYGQTLEDSRKWLAKYGQETEGQVRTTQDLRKANIAARQSIIDQNNALKETTISAKAASVGLKALSIAGNIAFNMAIVMVINAIVSSITHLVNAIEETKEKAEGFASSVTQMNPRCAAGCRCTA